MPPIPPPGPLAVLACAALLLGGCAERPEPADLVLLHGKVVTVDPALPRAAALAVRDGRIAAVGNDAEIARYVDDATRVLDLGGRLAIPGFIESHGHLVGLGRARRTLDLREAATWDDVVRRVAEAAGRTPPGEWIQGWGWHQEKWSRPPEPAVEGYPVHDALSLAVPDHPVILKHAAGAHMGIANLRALELAGVGPETPDPPGGEILRDARGRPTGVLREAAYEIVLRALEEHRARRTPEEAEAEARREIELAAQECLGKGVTTFQDAGSPIETLERMRAMAAEGRLGIRVWAMISEPDETIREHLDEYPVVGAEDGRFTVRAIKREIDGALGSHGAWLLEPYSDLPGHLGHNTTPVASLEATARLALEQGFQLCIHAIGTRANRETLDLYERVLSSVPDGRERRWRIEHAQHLAEEDIPRFARLGVIASMQGIHCSSDGPWVLARLGDSRAREGAYAWRKLLDSGAILANGTDTPVEDVDPVACFHASVTRKLADGSVFYPEQRMTREEALRSYTLDAARAAFEEDVKGSLTPGKLADIVVLDRDILSVPDDEIREARVVWTIVGGRIAYAGPGAD